VIGVASSKWTVTQLALCTREDAVEAAWAAADPILERHRRAIQYRCGSWGPREADALIAASGTWHNPILGRAKA
jgi:glucose-6-phosphate 1-dehydrogenase